jgi:hypothetical protein
MEKPEGAYSLHPTFGDTKAVQLPFRVCLCGARIAKAKIQRARGFAISAARPSVSPALNVLSKMLMTPNSVHSVEPRWSLFRSITSNLNLATVAWRENGAI